MRAAVELQSAWVPRTTHEQVEEFLLRFPDVPRAEAYKLRKQFDLFDLSKQASAAF
jgi:hypothetical protein